MSETRIAIFTDDELTFEGIAEDLKLNGIDVKFERPADTERVVVIGGGDYSRMAQLTRLQSLTRHDLTFPIYPTRREAVAKPAPVKEFTEQDHLRIQAAKAKRARKASKLRKETKQ